MSLQTDMSPAENFYAVTPNDSVDITPAQRALVISVGGTLKVTTLGGVDVTLTVPAGVLPIKVRRVWSAGTTATGISALV